MSGLISLNDFRSFAGKFWLVKPKAASLDALSDEGLLAQGTSPAEFEKFIATDGWRPTHLGVAIVIEASLGFLGVGIPPPEPTWGNMLSDALNAGLVPPWWLVLFPGLAITVTVLAFNLLGDGLRDALDPKDF